MSSTGATAKLQSLPGGSTDFVSQYAGDYQKYMSGGGGGDYSKHLGLGNGGERRSVCHNMAIWLGSLEFWLEAVEKIPLLPSGALFPFFWGVSSTNQKRIPGLLFTWASEFHWTRKKFKLPNDQTGDPTMFHYIMGKACPFVCIIKHANGPHKQHPHAPKYTPRLLLTPLHDGTPT